MKFSITNINILFIYLLTVSHNINLHGPYAHMWDNQAACPYIKTALLEDTLHNNLQIANALFFVSITNNCTLA